MTKDSSNPRSPVKPISQSPERLFNEFADLIFLALNHCTNEPQLTNFSWIADENGVALGQIVAAAMAQMAILLSHFPVEVHGRAVGILFATASIGWTVLPMVIGAIATQSTLQRGYLVAVGCGMVLLALVTGHFHLHGEIVPWHFASDVSPASNSLVFLESVCRQST